MLYFILPPTLILNKQLNLVLASYNERALTMTIIILNRNFYFIGDFAINLLIDVEEATFKDSFVMSLIFTAFRVCNVH